MEEIVSDMLSTEGSGSISQGVIEEIAPNQIYFGCALPIKNLTLTEEVESHRISDMT